MSERESIVIDCKSYTQLADHIRWLFAHDILGFEYHWVNLQNRVIFYFDRPEDATLFALGVV